MESFVDYNVQSKLLYGFISTFFIITSNVEQGVRENEGKGACFERTMSAN